MPKPKSAKYSSLRKDKGGNDNNKKSKKNKLMDPRKKYKLPPSMLKRGNKKEVVFDPEARRDHLRGFSDRKRQRRAFGLAMQKVKDRKSKIEQRAAEKKDEIQKIEVLERQKDELLEEVFRMNNATVASFGGSGIDSDEDSDNEKSGKNMIKIKSSSMTKYSSDTVDDDDDSRSENKNKKQPAKKQKQPSEKDAIDTKVYDDKKTEKHWGGQVTVTTSVVELDDLGGSDSDDGEEDDDVIDNSIHRNNSKPKGVDQSQKYAGNVKRYMNELKGNMPGKKNKDGSKTLKRKGRDGADGMKGVGGSGSLKIASKLLSKSKERRPQGSDKQKGKKGKKR
jgi:ribosomal RNA-processing protein 17